MWSMAALHCPKQPTPILRQQWLCRIQQVAYNESFVSLREHGRRIDRYLLCRSIRFLFRLIVVEAVLAAFSIVVVFLHTLTLHSGSNRAYDRSRCPGGRPYLEHGVPLV